ncbi:MAG: hypothetical protein R2911_07365 [Caldilineaceae bacterium]
MQIDIGKMMAFMQYAMQIIMAFLMLSMMFIMIPRAAVSANRVKEVIETDTVIKDKKHGGGQPRILCRILNMKMSASAILKATSRY